MAKNKKNKKFQKAMASSRAIRGIQRRNHFANGGTLAGWRGSQNVETDRKKAASKKACRGRVVL